MKNHESLAIRENEKNYSSKIELFYFRHDKKGKPAAGESDIKVHLTPEGRTHALQAGINIRESQTDKLPGVAFGSFRERAQETVGFIMGGEGITGEESLEELKTKLDAGREHGTRLGTKVNLDFDLGSPEFERLMVEAFDNKQGLRWMIEESDKVAKELNDKKGTTYTSAAAALANDIKRYLSIAPRFDSLVRGGKYPDAMVRYNGSHTGVVECFLAKVLEKTKGVEARDNFINTLDDGAGFGFSEGYKVEIDTPKSPDDKPSIIVLFKKEDTDGKLVYEMNEKITPELIDDIIKDGNPEE